MSRVPYGRDSGRAIAAGLRRAAVVGAEASGAARDRLRASRESDQRQATAHVIAAAPAEELELGAKSICDVQNLSLLEQIEERLCAPHLVSGSSKPLHESSLSGEASRALTDVPLGLGEMIQESGSIHS